MGYFTLDFKKAKGASDARMSDHIERRVIASNVDPTRTHLNRELAQLPEGVTERDEAIAHRIKSAGIKRKITPDQVRAIRVMLSGTHEAMMKIQQDGRIDEWCDDSMQWLHKTFGKENTVSAVLHMDETTPHIHATIMPIVTGERRKAKQLKQVKREINTEKLEVVKTEAKTALIAKVGSLLGGGEIKELKQENELLRGEVAVRDEGIEKLLTLIQEQRRQHGRELTEVQAKYIKEQNEQKGETNALKKWINRACRWFPLFDDAFRMEKFCLAAGFTMEQTDRLFTFRPLEYSGNLYSEEYRRSLSVTNATAQIKIVQEDKKQRFVLHINGKNIFDWFKEQFYKLYNNLKQSTHPTIKKGKGMKL